MRKVELESVGGHIVAVDDDPEQRLLLEEVLGRDGWTVSVAPDARRAVERIRAEAPDVVVLDVAMPDESGFDLLQRLRRDVFPSAEVPPFVLFVTGRSDAAHVVRGYDLGAVDYIRKPWHPAELVARVRAAMRNRRTLANLAQRASHDPLTGLLNRSLLVERTEQAIAAARRDKTSLSVLLLDLDHFKRINDGYGHAVGDRVLCGVAERLQSVIRRYDFAFRYGGEEFLLLAERTNLTEGLALARRVRESISQRPISSTGQGSPPLNVTASLGLAVWRPDVDVAQLVQRADAALYAAKHRGRNRVVAWSSRVSECNGHWGAGPANASVES